MAAGVYRAFTGRQPIVGHRLLRHRQKYIRLLLERGRHHHLRWLVLSQFIRSVRHPPVCPDQHLVPELSHFVIELDPKKNAIPLGSHHALVFSHLLALSHDALVDDWRFGQRCDHDQASPQVW